MQHIVDAEKCDLFDAMMTVVFLIAAVADTMTLPGDGPAFSIHGSGRRRFSPSATAAGPIERR